MTPVSIGAVTFARCVLRAAPHPAVLSRLDRPGRHGVGHLHAIGQPRGDRSVREKPPSGSWTCRIANRSVRAARRLTSTLGPCPIRPPSLGRDSQPDLDPRPWPRPTSTRGGAPHHGEAIAGVIGDRRGDGAVARDYADVALIVGIVLASGFLTLKVDVAPEPLEATGPPRRG